MTRWYTPCYIFRCPLQPKGSDHMMDNAARVARRKVEKIVKQYGGEIEIDRDSHNITVRVIAPEGHHWGDETHEYVQHVFVGPWSYAQMWNDALLKIEGNPPEPCHDGCEYWEEA